ncbi:MAG: MerR family transcriptional regulator [Lachnospiraceae bacterium]|nr:MerR family transcriptional regulator [Lachnospiraceae bacterium]
MKIKEVEQLTGMKSANIRYYESKELIVPSRQGNNYREYSEEDVEMLRKIKVMRLLGISVEDVRKIFTGELSMEDAVSTRLTELDAEAKSIKETQAACNAILEQHLQINDLSESILSGTPSQWEPRMKQIRMQDADKSFLIKGMLLMAVLPIFYLLMTLAHGNFINTGNPDGNRIVIGAGCFFILYSYILCIYEGAKGYGLTWSMGAGTNWQAPGLGILSNSYSICSIGLVLFGAIYGLSIFFTMYLIMGILLCGTRIYFIKKDIHPIKRAVM